MLKKHLSHSLVNFVIVALHLLGQYLNNTVLMSYTKPLMLIWLAVFLVLKTGLKGRFHKRIITGLGFAIIADLLLLRSSNSDQYFIYGLLAFMLCNVFYIRAFYLDFKSAPELDKRGARIAIISCALLSTIFFFMLRPHLGGMRVLILAYIIVISMMVMMAAFRNQRVNKESFQLILIGAVLFMLSDAFVAYDKFIYSFYGSHLIIALSYISAQYLITLGAVERQLVHKG
jgi:uncharacterized membrane protein YhhN